MEFSTEELRLIDTSLGLMAADLQILQTSLPVTGEFAEEDTKARAKLADRLVQVRELRIRLRTVGGL